MKIVFTIIVCFLCTSLVAQNVGVKTTAPQAALDVNGRIKVGDELSIPQAGTIRWNTSSNDFEGYDGSRWITLTNKNGGASGWGNITLTETFVKTSGEAAANDEFGASVCIDGDYAIIGAPGKTIGSATEAGKAYIFIKSGNNWERQMILTASSAAPGDNFGNSVSISGNTAVVGAYKKVTGAGAVYIYVRSGTTWTQQAAISNPAGTLSKDEFGYSVSIHGDYVIIGAPYKDIGVNQDQGMAYVYLRSGTTWTQQAALTASNGAIYDRYANSVSINGDYIIIGAPFLDDGIPHNNMGAVYIYQRTGTVWAQQAQLIASDRVSNEYFGFSVGINGEYAIIGAYEKRVGTITSGKAYIFKRNGTIWTEQAGLVASNPVQGDRFGISVSINSDYAVVGASFKNSSLNTWQGLAYLFIRSGTSWNQQIILNASNGEANSFFGSGVSVSGNTIITGAKGKSANGLSNAGAVYFFQRN